MKISPTGTLDCLSSKRLCPPSSPTHASCGHQSIHAQEAAVATLKIGALDSLLLVSSWHRGREREREFSQRRWDLVHGVSLVAGVRTNRLAIDNSRYQTKLESVLLNLKLPKSTQEVCTLFVSCPFNAVFKLSK